MNSTQTPENRRILWAAALAAGAAWLAGARRPSRRDARPYRGKVALITGGSRGLGLVLARQLASQGARLALCARSGPELAEARHQLERELGAEVLTLPCDVGRAREAERTVALTYAKYRRIDLVVNNASIIQVGPAEAMGLGDYRAAMDANFWGTVHVALAALPHLERSRGTVINICSVGGAVPVPHLLPYTCAKFAVSGFSQGLAVEARKRGVRVLTVYPWLMRTGSYLRALFKGRRPIEYRVFSVSASLPLLTLDSERAASRILRAQRDGRSTLVLGAPAKALRLAFALAPGLLTATLALLNRLLPEDTERGSRSEPGIAGRYYDDGFSRAPWMRLASRAARRNLEVGDPGDPTRGLRRFDWRSGRRSPGALGPAA